MGLATRRGGGGGRGGAGVYGGCQRNPPGLREGGSWAADTTVPLWLISPPRSVSREDGCRP